MYEIKDFWTLARPKLPQGYKYYGSYPAGFLERARPLLGCNFIDTDSILHVCSGHVHKYNDSVGVYLSGYGENDICLDIDDGTTPHLWGDALALHKVIVNAFDNTLAFPTENFTHFTPIPANIFVGETENVVIIKRPRAVLIDRPYTEADAQNYRMKTFPNLSDLVAYSLALMPKYGLVGVLDYEWAKPKKQPIKIDYRTYATIGVSCGENNRSRNFIVYQRM